MKVFQPFRIDVRNQCLWRNGDRIKLTPKTFSLLAYLVDNAGSLLSQTDIIDKLWPDTFIQPEVLKTHVRDLRSALDDDAKNPRFIETHHRRGYRFIAPVFENEDIKHRVELAPLATTVGQESNLETLRAIFQKACSGDPQLVFLKGEVGIGKTTLANSFERELSFAKTGARVVRGQCVKLLGDHEPYYPILEAISNLIRLPGSKAAVTEILASQAPAWIVQFPALVTSDDLERLRRDLAGTTRERMLRELCEAMEKIAKEWPLVVILEDVHWTDPYTIDWLSAFAHGNRNAKLMVVATFRPLELILTNNPLKELRHSLLSRKLCTEITLESLSEPAVQQFLEHKAPDGQVPPGLTQLVFQHAEGNPFFTEAVLEHLFAQGILSISRGAWVFTLPASQTVQMVPETLRQLVQDQIEFMLSEAEIQVLEAASVCGVSFTAAFIEKAAGRNSEEVEEICYNLSRRGQFIRSLGSIDLPGGLCLSQFEFVHSLYCDGFYQRIAPSRKVRFHRQVARQIESLYSKSLDEVAPQLAFHFEKCSEWASSAQYMLLVAKTEARRFAHSDAIQVLKHALELLKDLPESEAEALRFRLRSELAEVLILMDNFFEATEQLKAASLSPVLAGNNLSKINMLMRLAFLYARTSGARCTAAADEALELSHKEDNSILRATTRLNAAFFHVVCEGWSAQYAEECASAFGELEPVSKPMILAHCQISYGVIQCLSSRYREGLDKIEIGIRVLMSAAHPFYEFGERADTWMLTQAGEWGEALTKVQAKIDVARRNGNQLGEKIFLLWLARIHQVANDHGGAIRYCCQSLSGPSNPETAWLERFCLIVLAASEVQVGSLEDARQHLNEADAILLEQGTLLAWYWKLHQHQGEFELLMRTGRANDARKAAQVFLSAAQATAELTWQALAWEASARSAMADDDLSCAMSCISSALEVMEGHELPVAQWRVHSTAMPVFPAQAERHRSLAAATVMVLADKLLDHPALQETFTSSTEVRDLLQNM